MTKSLKYLCFALALSQTISCEDTAIAKEHMHRASHHVRSAPAYGYSAPDASAGDSENHVGSKCHVPLPFTYTCD